MIKLFSKKYHIDKEILYCKVEFLRYSVWYGLQEFYHCNPSVT